MSALAIETRPVAVTSRPTLTADLAAVAANTRDIAAHAPGAALMAVVKADGFGHGAAEVAVTALAAGATRLGVTSVDEALALRAAGVGAPILSWLNPVDADYAAAVAAGTDLAVPSRDHLDAVVAAATTAGTAHVHLHLDTGLARDGAPLAEWARLCRAARLAEQRGLLRVDGVMGHLACADVPADPSNATGRTRFAWGVEVARATGLRPAHRHLAATAATLTDPRTHHTLVRVGAGLFGIDPSGTVRLRPALTLTAPVVSVRRVRAGTPVGYGHTWTVTAATHLGLLPLGYADGLPRSASGPDGRAEVLVRGRRRRVVGLISMDQAVVDLGDDAVSPGEVATVFGPGDDGEPTAADWAAWAGTIEHEIVTGIGGRVTRRTVGDEHLHAPVRRGAHRTAGPTGLRSVR
ncbi:alanine racemase [Jiangella ureilytica]|uniref:Alanine racemase n=1 Tax=Jiangella ureilytica TaxID=2530374 RepID=A0A4R4RKH4_9ACTN|nr:alanine racemase [Jiangella ureilytica]TDC49112.1 alanine racemase [Jiangella ureilytica]